MSDICRFDPIAFRPVGSWFNGLCSGFNEFFMDLDSTLEYDTIMSATRPKPHENRRFFSTGMEFAENTYAYVLKAPSRS